MDKKTFLKKMPPLRLAVYVFCAAMFVAMTAITAVRAVNGGLTERMVVMIGNCLLWLLPFVCRPLFKDKISDGVYAFAAVYAFFASFLGTIMGFYGKVWWYDMAMHTLFGYVGAVIGLFFACKLSDAEKLSPVFLAFFCFAVSLMFAALWEVFEFSGDMILNNNAQGEPITLPDGQVIRPVADTMEDIICNLCGAAAFVIHYAAHAISRRSLGFNALIRDFSKGKKPAHTAAGTQTEGTFVGKQAAEESAPACGSEEKEE